MTDKPIYTYMLDDHGAYVVIKNDKDVNPQELCTHLNALETQIEGFKTAIRQARPYVESIRLPNGFCPGDVLDDAIKAAQEEA